MSIIKFALGEPLLVTLDYDSGQRVDGDYGTQFKFGCNDGEDMFYATPTLATLIDQTTDGKGKGVEILITKTTKTDKHGKDIPIFTVNNKSMDDWSLPNPVIADSPVGAGFAHKDTKDGTLSMSDHEYRIGLLEATVAVLREKHTSEMLEHDEKAEAELPF
jgi:hypothetical protein